jgi:hypothetical protein
MGETPIHPVDNRKNGGRRKGIGNHEAGRIAVGDRIRFPGANVPGMQTLYRGEICTPVLFLPHSDKNAPKSSDGKENQLTRRRVSGVSIPDESDAGPGKAGEEKDMSDRCETCMFKVLCRKAELEDCNGKYYVEEAEAEWHDKPRKKTV